jgi:hypothetical protein
VDNIKKFKTFVFGVTEEEEKIGVKYIWKVIAINF